MKFNIIGITFIVFFIISVIIKLFLDILNFIHRDKNKNFIPEELKDLVDKDKLLKINNYSNDKLRFNLIEYSIKKILLLIIIFSNIIPFYYNFIKKIIDNIYLNNIMFFLSFFIFQFIISLPFSFYFNFNIEKRYEFNKMTISLWISDIIKNLLITIILSLLILFPLVIFIYNFKEIWFLLIWITMLIFSLLMQIVYPSIIAPLFNKFEPLKNQDLKNKIEELVINCGFKTKDIFQMDETKRSSHSNAYFIGLGKTKRIILFDTLLKNHPDDEIMAIIAHELGHFKYRHIFKNLIFSSIFTLISLIIAKIFIESSLIYENFNFNDILPPIGLFYFWIITEPIIFLFTPLKAFFSKKNEYKADNFAKEKLNDSIPLINALKKLSVYNLSNLYPHPIYEWFYYSHPSILNRIKALKG